VLISPPPVDFQNQVLNKVSIPPLVELASIPGMGGAINLITLVTDGAPLIQTLLPYETRQSALAPLSNQRAALVKVVIRTA
jgi:hypothetical protein